MHSIKSLALLAIAGSAFAAPANAPRNPDVVVVYETVVHTAIVTDVVGAEAPKTSATPQVQAAEVVYQTVYHTHHGHHPKPSSSVAASSVPAYTPAPPPPPPPASSEAPAYTPPPPPPSTPAYTPEPTPTPTPSPAPSSGGYMDIVNEWRGKLGLDALEHDATLEANAVKTCVDGHGEMKHELNKGSFAQVLAPGKMSDFYHIFVGGWLCEKANMPGMNGICATASSGWYYTSTGHADILSNKDYHKIGCGEADGIVGCDLS